MTQIILYLLSIFTLLNEIGSYSGYTKCIQKFC